MLDVTGRAEQASDDVQVGTPVANHLLDHLCGWKTERFGDVADQRPDPGLMILQQPRQQSAQRQAYRSSFAERCVNRRCASSVRSTAAASSSRNAAMITGGNPTNPPIEAVSWFSAPAQRSGGIPRRSWQRKRDDTTRRTCRDGCWGWS